MRILLIITISLLHVFSGWSQMDRIAESDIQDEAKFLEALQLRLLEEWDESLELFKELERADPLNDVLQFEMAKIYHKKEDQTNAIEYAKRASDNDPEKMVYREFLVELLNQVKDYSQLNEQLEIFIDQGKFDEENYYQMARNYENLGNMKSALKTLEKLERKIGYDKRLGRAKIRIFQKQRNKKQLVKELNKLTESFPGQIDLLKHKAVLMHSMNMEEEALEAYREILKYDPDNVEATVFINGVESQAKTRHEFLQSNEPIIRNQNVEMDRKIKLLIPYVSQVSRDQLLREEMLSMMEILQKMYPGNAKVHALHGDVYYHSDLLEKAAFHYKESTKQSQGVFLVWKNLMLCYDNSKNFEELKKVAEEAVEYYPNQAVCYYYVGRANVELDDMEEALDWVEEGIMMSGNNKKLKMEFELIRSFVYLNLNQENTARSIYEMIDKAIFSNNHAFFLEVKGDFLQLDGQQDEALKNWQRSIEFGGNINRLNKKIKAISN